MLCTVFDIIFIINYYLLSVYSNYDGITDLQHLTQKSYFFASVELSMKGFRTNILRIIMTNT